MASPQPTLETEKNGRGEHGSRFGRLGVERFRMFSIPLSRTALDVGRLEAVDGLYGKRLGKLGG